MGEKMSDPQVPPSGQPDVAPGWYADPDDGQSLRYWSGDAWTDAKVPLPEAASPEEQSTTKDQSNTTRNALIAVGLVVLVGIGVVVGLILLDDQGGESGDPSDVVSEITSVEVDYQLLLGESCSHAFGEFDGYSDIDLGTEIEVVDGSGNLLGFGNIEDSKNVGSSCLYSASFTIEPSPDDVYRVTAGNESRGYLNFRSSDVVDGTLTVESSLG